MIEKIRVTNRSMSESKLGGMDSGNVFGGRISGQEWARRRNGRGAGMGAEQIGRGADWVRGRTGVNRSRICAAYRSAAG